jgi:protein SCO1/2
MVILASPRGRRRRSYVCRVLRRIVLAVALASLLAGCGGSKATQPGGSGFAGNEISPPLRAPQLALDDQHGRLVRLSDLRGKTVLVTFLYTHCPDVCPLIATNLNVALHRLGPARDRRVRVVVVSVDPKGDTPASVRRFIRVHRLLPQFHYLTGTRTQLAPVWRRYHIAVAGGPEDTVNHSAYTVLVDARGDERVLYDAQVEPAQVVHDVKLLDATT